MNENNEIPTIEKPNLFNIQAEQIVLGTIILNNEYLAEVLEILKKEYFYEPAHQIIYEHIIHTTQRANIVADSITLKTFFDNDELLKTIGGSQYLSILLSMGAGIVDIVDYAKIVQDLALKRLLVFIGEEIVNNAYKKASTVKATEQIEKATDKLFSLQEKAGFKKRLVHLVNPMAEKIHKIHLCRQDPNFINKILIKTGFRDWDLGIDYFNKLGGFSRKKLIILAGKTSMGKSTIALNIGYNVVKQDLTTAIFSLEMNEEEIVDKLTARETKINSRRIQNYNIYDDEFDDFVSIANKISKNNLYIDDSCGINCSHIRNSLKRLIKIKPIDLVIVDHIQLMTGIKYNSQNRNLELGEITYGLKEIAKDFNCCVLALSQLNRKGGERDDKIPRLEDLRESGNIEQNADMVIFTYRKIYYRGIELNILKASKHKYESSIFESKLRYLKDEIASIKNDCQLIIAKHRGGCKYTINVNFYPEYSAVENKVIKENKQFRGGN